MQGPPDRGDPHFALPPGAQDPEIYRGFWGVGMCTMPVIYQHRELSAAEQLRRYGGVERLLFTLPGAAGERRRDE
jgi:hypothetical protein